MGGGQGSSCLLNHLPFYLKGRVSQILLTARYLIQGLSNQIILGSSVKRILNRVFFSRIWQSLKGSRELSVFPIVSRPLRHFVKQRRMGLTAPQNPLWETHCRQRRLSELPREVLVNCPEKSSDQMCPCAEILEPVEDLDLTKSKQEV